MNESQLIMLGISSEHIQWLKDTKVCSKPQNEYCYIEDGSSRFELVPVKKIVGLGMRGENNSSWWEHFVGEKGTLTRLNSLIGNLNSSGLTQFVETFKHEKFSREIKIEYYAEEDIYYTNTGQHRTVMAKVVNAPYILAEVSIFRLDLAKQKEYELQIKTIKEIEFLLKNLDFEMKEQEICWRDNKVIPNLIRANIKIISLLKTSDILNLLNSLEEFKDAVDKVEKLHLSMSNNLFLRLKINIQKKLGIYKPIKYENKIIDLKEKGWKYRL